MPESIAVIVIIAMLAGAAWIIYALSRYCLRWWKNVGDGIEKGMRKMREDDIRQAAKDALDLEEEIECQRQFRGKNY